MARLTVRPVPRAPLLGLLLPLVTVAITWAACDSPTPESSDPRAPLGGKGDFIGDVATGPNIDFGTDDDALPGGSFAQDFDRFAFRFDARADAVITAETIGAAELDTRLFLYRLGRGTEPRRIVWDDNDGEDRLSKISAFQLYTAGTYALVVDSAAGDGRGDFRVRLQCDSGNCAPEGQPEPNCAEPITRDLVDCVAEETAAVGYETELANLLDPCGSTEYTEGYVRSFCGSGEPATWCDDPGVVSEHVSRCENEFKSLYPLAGPTTAALQPLESTTIDSIEQLVRSGSVCGGVEADGGCDFTIEAYRTTDEVTLYGLMAHARALPGGLAPGVFPRMKSGPEAWQAYDELVGRFGIGSAVAQAVSDLGASLDDGDLIYAGDDDFQLGYGSCGGELVAVRFAASQLALIVGSESCWD